MRRAAVLLAIAAAALVVAGCGLGAGTSVGGARITVTRDFGASAVGHVSQDKLPGGETVMRFLERFFHVRTRYGGAFVQSIQGISGGTQGGRPVDWFYYVNGVEASRGAASVSVHRGDRIWWDRHDWGAAMRVPAVVGSFPEPFVSGTGGKRIPVRVECAAPGAPACAEVARRLDAVGVPAARGAIGTVSSGKLLRVLVGTWPQVRIDPGARQIERGPTASGVYARLDRSGRTLQVLDARGRVSRTLGAGSGLVAAVRYLDGQPTWVVTGTDSAGVKAAARALRPTTLANRFAVAVAPGGQAVPAPEMAAR